ncbi:nucleotidyltransferase [Bacillus sp. FJAT-49736]|uniref:nucleotidyltransferase n=1 Tax=Bacillus sp. FJAT-49736 TaxID=2833582 RepID=UPI001BC97C6C|nr:nucleotidyltransferase [Bacillus sp. FJAT-49736]MBS4172406.1 nucleotidyltransferase [Bacillus sp. FJAT-49736]
MNSTGIIVEYNPFHNGHLYHFLQSKEAARADIVIAVMSGNFLQRGEPAIVSKWARTKMALEAGVDLVVELPYKFAVQQAEIFALGSVAILDALGCKSFCFGSESGNIEVFEKTIRFLDRNQEHYNENIKKYMQEGNSYPSALSKSFQDLFFEDDLLDLSKPNNILGYQYIKMRNQIHSDMKAKTIPRKNANYHDEDFSSSTIASATAIRKAIFEQKDTGAIQQYVPVSTYNGLINYKEHFGDLHHWEMYWPFLQYKLLTSKPEEIARYYEVEEGIEHRLLREAEKAISFYDFMKRVKTKRYTWTRIQRMCVHILTNTKKIDMKNAKNLPEYIRLLGMSQGGRKYLNERKKDISLPIISKLSSFDNAALDLDIKAARTYALGLKEPERHRLMKMEFSQPPILL